MLRTPALAKSESKIFDLISIAFVGYTIFFCLHPGIYIAEINFSMTSFGREFLIFLFVAYWVFLCPTKKYCDGYWLTALLYSLMPWAIFNSDIFLQYNFGISLTIFFVLLVAKTLTVLKTRTKITKRIQKYFYSRLFISMDIIILTILMIYSAAAYNFTYPLDALAEKTAQEHSSVARSAWSDTDFEREFYASLCGDSWKKESLEQRMQLLQSVVDHESVCLGVQNDPPLLCAKAMDDFTAGYYAGSTKILINVEYLMESDSIEALDTVLHELFHYYQKLVIESVDWTNDNAGLSYFDEARSWYLNKSDYKDDYTTEAGIQEYLDQPLEESAREFAERRLKEYSLKIEAAEKLP